MRSEKWTKVRRGEVRGEYNFTMYVAPHAPFFLEIASTVLGDTAVAADGDGSFLGIVIVC